MLVFEDIHWAEEPLLDLVEHLASGVRDVPLLIVCLARPDLLDGGRAGAAASVRATAIELEPLPRDESGQLVDALADGEALELTPDQREAVLDTTDGNPLFIEETMRMLVECRRRADADPRHVQAMIAARIDRLPAAERKVLRRAAVVGRTFWSGAIEAIGEDSEPIELDAGGARRPRLPRPGAAFDHPRARRRSASSTC